MQRFDSDELPNKRFEAGSLCRRCAPPLNQSVRRYITDRSARSIDSASA